MLKMMRSRRLERVRACSLAAAAIVAACGTACRQAPDPSEAPAAASPDTWAVVNGQPITREQVDKAYRRAQDPGEARSEEEILAAKLTLLNDLIVEELLLAKARALALDVAPSELDAAYDNAKKNIPDAEYQLELTKRQLTPEDMREGLRRGLLTQKVIEQEVGTKIAVSEQEIADFFNANRARFNIPEEAYHVAQIVITPSRDPQITNGTGDDAATPAAAAAKAKMLMERLNAGASFPDLAMGYSEDAESAPRGGDLGLIPVSRLKQAPPNLRDAVLNKKPGEVSVVSSGGAHTIVLVLAREQAGQRDLSTPQVREQITNELRGRKEQLLRTAYLTALRSDAEVVNHLARRIVESSGRAADVAPILPGAR